MEWDYLNAFVIDVYISKCCYLVPLYPLVFLISFCGDKINFYPSFHVIVSSDVNFALIGVPYQLDQLPNNQPKLSAFFSLRSSKMSEDAFTNGLCQVESDVEDSSTRVGKSENRHSSKVGKMVEPSRKISAEADDIVSENTNSTLMKEPTSVGVICDEEDHAGGSNDAAEDEINVQGELEPNNQEPSASVSSQCSDDQNVNKFPSSAVTRASKQCHSTLADPNFVENYFKVKKLKEVWIFILVGDRPLRL